MPAADWRWPRTDFVQAIGTADNKRDIAAAA